jgi:hypothetical protein
VGLYPASEVKGGTQIQVLRPTHTPIQRVHGVLYPEGADHSPPSNAEQKLYLLSTQAPPWRVAGQLFFYSSPDITRMIKSSENEQRILRTREGGNAYKILVGGPKGKRSLGRPRRR